MAGAVGTAAITVSQMVEMRMTGREASSSAADAAGKVLGVQPRDSAGQARFGTIVHWLYGTSWGALQGTLGGIGLRAPVAGAGTFAGVWGSEQVMLPALIDSEPITEQQPKAIAIDVMHHVVYATATAATFAWLSRSATTRTG